MLTNVIVFVNKKEGWGGKRQSERVMKRKRDGEIIIIFILIHPYYFNQTSYRVVQSRILITVPTPL